MANKFKNPLLEAEHALLAEVAYTDVKKVVVNGEITYKIDWDGEKNS
jgi:hypothetical protein